MNGLLEHVNSAGQWFAGSAGAMLLQSSVLIVILFLADFALRKKVRAVFRYWLWMLVLVKLVLPVTLGTPFSLGNFVGEGLFTEVRVEEPARKSGFELKEPFSVEGTRPVPAASAEAEAAGPAVQPVAVAAVRWEGAIFLIWAIVVLVMMVMLLQRAFFVFGLVAQAGEASERMRDELERCREKMGMRGKVGLKLSANATSPAVCGLFRPVILVPQDLEARLDGSQMRAVLMHELAHIRRGDLWVNLAQTVLQIVYFYNPLLWVANAVIRRVREQAVDEAVLVAMGEGARQYPETLVNVAKMAFGRPALSLRLIGVVESKSALKSRVKRMLERPLPKSAKLGIAGLIIVLFFGSVLLPMAKLEPGAPDFVIKGTVTDADTGELVAGAKVGDNKEYNDGKFCTVTDSSGNYEYKTWYEEHGTKCEAAGYKTEKKILLTKLFGSEKEKVINFALTPVGDSGPSEFKASLDNGVTAEAVDIKAADFDIRSDVKRGVCNLVVSIQNDSDVAIPKFRLNFYRGEPSSNMDEAGNVHSGWHEAGPIEPDKEWNERTRDFHLPDGEYEFNVVLDYDDNVPEVDEGNNQAVLKVRTQNGKIVEKSVICPGKIEDSKTASEVEGGVKVGKADKLASEDLTADGWALWRDRKLAEAEEKFKEAEEKDPTNDGAYQGLGWAQLNQGKKLNAKDSFEKCIEINPKNSAALNGLGWIAHGEGNEDEAIAWWEKAIAAQPGATASLSGLTQVYMERKQYDKAIKYYNMWLAVEPGNSQAKAGLEEAQLLNDSEQGDSKTGGGGGESGSARRIRKLIVKRDTLKRWLADHESFQGLPNAEAKIAEYKEKLEQIKKAEEEPVPPEVAKRREKEWENFRKTHGEDHTKVYSYVRSAVSRLVLVEARNTDIEPFTSYMEEVEIILKLWVEGFNTYPKLTKVAVEANLEKVAEKYSAPPAVIERAREDSKKELYLWGYEYLIQLFSKEKGQQWQKELEETETKLERYPDWQNMGKELLEFLNLSHSE